MAGCLSGAMMVIFPLWSGGREKVPLATIVSSEKSFPARRDFVRTCVSDRRRPGTGPGGVCLRADQFAHARMASHYLSDSYSFSFGPSRVLPVPRPAVERGGHQLSQVRALQGACCGLAVTRKGSTERSRRRRQKRRAIPQRGRSLRQPGAPWGSSQTCVPRVPRLRIPAFCRRMAGLLFEPDD